MFLCFGIEGPKGVGREAYAAPSCLPVYHEPPSKNLSIISNKRKFVQLTPNLSKKLDDITEEEVSKIYRLERCVEVWFNIADFYKHKVNYLIISIVTAILAYLSITKIIKFPKPETFSSFMKYYFSAPGEYLLSLALIFLTAVSLIILGLATTTNAVRLYEEFYLYWLIPMALFGTALVIGSFYFLNYFIFMSFVLVVLGIAFFAITTSSESNRRR
ncbi:hypothetical protein [Terribacillus sp. 7520-G]|uniref:hypothetical protein n=1 Tax=Terribacillus TaxID=459532 RepID=UPI000BA6AA07|nr:hypothetical protein [Terribacillus sp. 7520-G]PAD38625.1 hypothetical protein CHH53_10365 [Terribacillus sp. 7520-G]